MPSLTIAQMAQGGTSSTLARLQRQSHAQHILTGSAYSAEPLVTIEKPASQDSLGLPSE